MILVEGPDGAGKTTLVKRLQKHYGLEIGERGVADRSLLYTVTRSDTYNALAHAVRADSKPRIWDRLFFSEMVYAPVVHRRCEFSGSEQSFVVEVLDALNCPVVVCLPPRSTVKANITQAKQMSGVNENIEYIYKAYDEEDLGWPAHTLWYDYTGIRSVSAINRPGDHNYVGYNVICAEIDDYLARRKEREV